MSDDDDYEVGYGKPPTHTRFQKGHSGNPRGRPKGRRNFSTEIKEVLEATLTVSRHGKKKRVTAREAALQRLVAKALSGDIRAIVRLIQLADRVDDEERAKTARKLSSNDEEILKRVAQKISLADVADKAEEGEGNGD